MERHDRGFLIALAGVVLTLLWIGVFKFTPTEAAAIRPLVASHPLMSWLYAVLSEQAVSNLIGLVEILIACGLIAGLWLGGKDEEVTFLATFKDGRKLCAVTDSKTWSKLDGNWRRQHPKPLGRA